MCTFTDYKDAKLNHQASLYTAPLQIMTGTVQEEKTACPCSFIRLNIAIFYMLFITNTAL